MRYIVEQRAFYERVKGAIGLIALFVLASAFGCSSSSDTGKAAEALEDRLHDNLAFEGGESKASPPPAGQTGDEAPQITKVEIFGELKLGSSFLIRLHSDYPEPELVNRAIVHVVGTRRHIVVAGQLLEDASSVSSRLTAADGHYVMEISGVLGQDSALRGRDFELEFALQKEDGLTGGYVQSTFDIPNVEAQEDFQSIADIDNEQGDRLENSERPSGSYQPEFPQIIRIIAPRFLAAADEWRMILETDYPYPEEVNRAVLATPNADRYLVREGDMDVTLGRLTITGRIPEGAKDGDSYTLLIALQTDEGETGGYRMWNIVIVDASEIDGDEEQAETEEKLADSSIEFLRIGDERSVLTDVSEIHLNMDSDTEADLPLLQNVALAKIVGAPLEAVAVLYANDEAIDSIPITNATSITDAKTARFEFELDDGAYEFIAKLEYQEESVASEAVRVAVDWQAPTIEFALPANDSFVNQRTIDILVRSDAEAGRIVSLEPLFASVSNTYEAMLNEAGKALFEDVALPDSLDAARIRAKVSDLLGNEGSGVLMFHIDDTPPEVLIESTAGVFVTEDDSIDLRVRVEDDNPPDTISIKLVKIDEEAAEELIVEEEIARENLLTRHTFTEVADGRYRVEAIAQDKAGNSGKGELELAVDGGCFTFSFTSPRNEAIFGLPDATEANPANGVAVDFVLTADGARPVPDGYAAVLEKDGGEIGRAVFSGGKAVFTAFALFEGRHTFTAYIVKDPDDTKCYAAHSGESFSLTVDFQVPTISLIEPIMPAPGTALLYNAESEDTSPAEGFQSTFIFQTSGASEGTRVTLNVSDEERRATETYDAAIDSAGKVYFNEVSLINATFSETTPLTLVGNLADNAGNMASSESIQVRAKRTMPEFVLILPMPGSLLNADNDNDSETDLFDFELEAHIENGTPGVEAVQAQTYPQSDVGNIDDLGLFELTSEGVVRIPATFDKDGSYHFILKHTDAYGNETSITPRYTIDFLASAALLDKESNLLDATSSNWGKTLDEQAITPGFQATFQAELKGFSTGRTLALCADPGLADGSGFGACSYNPTFQLIAQALVNNDSDSGATLITFPMVSLLNEAEHRIYVEGVDAGGNQAHSEVFNVRVDSIIPSIESIDFQQNDISNDADGVIVLNRNEGSLSGNTLITDVLITAPGESFDLARGAVRFESGELDPGFIEATLGETLLFDNDGGDGLVLPNGTEGTLVFTIEDTVGNRNDSASERARVGVLVDVVAPIANVEGGRPGTPVIFNQEACNIMQDGQPCNADVVVLVEEDADEAFPIADGTVTLTAGEYEQTQTIPSTELTPKSLTFRSVSLPEGESTIELLAKDTMGNERTTVQEVFVATEGATLAFVTPDETVTSYTAADNDDVTCGSGGGLTDYKLRRCDWVISIADVTQATNVSLEYRKLDGSAFEELSAIGSFTEDNANIALGAVDLPRGRVEDGYRIEVRLKGIAEGSGNQSYSSTREFTMDFAPDFKLMLERATGDGTLDTGDEMQSGDSFIVEDDVSPATNSFAANLRIVTDLPEGTLVELRVNGQLVQTARSPSVGLVTAGGTLVYNGVALQSTPETNAISLKAETEFGDIIETDLAGILADDNPPDVEFVSLSASETNNFNATHDTDGTMGNGISPIATKAIRVAADIEAGQTVTLSAKMTDAAQTPVSLSGVLEAVFDATGEAAFSEVQLPNTESYPNGTIALYAETSDAAGNESVLVAPVVIRVDDDPPSDPANLKVCLGSNTAETGEKFADDAICQAAYACNGDRARCSRSRGKAALVFEASWANANQMNATLAGERYGVMWNVANNVDDACAGFTTESANFPTSGVTITADAAPASAGNGETQTLIISGLPVNTDSSVCLLVYAEDAAGNRASNVMSLEREIRLKTHEFETLADNVDTLLGEGYAFGDFNGDGKGDVALGDPAWGTVGESDLGIVYVYYGSKDADSDEPVNTAADWSTSPPVGADMDNTRMGRSIGAGDVNGDGYDDLVVGAEGWGDGRIFIYYGSETGLSTTAGSINQPTKKAEVTLFGASGGQTGEFLGREIAVLDFTGDGYEDIVAWANDSLHTICELYFVFGRSRDDWVSLDNRQLRDKEDIRILREDGFTESGCQMGSSLSVANINGEDNEELLISDHDHWEGGSDPLHQMWIYQYNAEHTGSKQLGADASFTKITNPADAASSDNDFGYSVFGLNDTDNDGADEFFVGIKLPPYELPSNVKFHYFTGTPTAGIGYSDSELLFSRNGGSDTAFGEIISSIGDFTGDGFQDVVVGATDTVRIYTGGESGLRDTHHYSLNAAESGRSWRAVGGFDFNGDGFSDILIFSPDTGQVRLLY